MRVLVFVVVVLSALLRCECRYVSYVRVVRLLLSVAVYVVFGNRYFWCRAAVVLAFDVGVVAVVFLHP